jgi:DNA-nicking Smr family endonuclease
MPMAKKPAPFNNPFRKLKVEPKKKLDGRHVAPVKPRPSASEMDEQRLFDAAMAGVQPLTPEPNRAPGPPPAEPRGISDDAEAYAQLAELVAGHGTFDIADTDEYIEGSAPGLDPQVVASLRKGQYAVQGHVDLHGMDRDVAKDAVEKFITASRKDGKRCVLVIHGRGLNSKDNIPVLKERLKVWLARGRIAKSVLAFATARQAEGGAGAVYVLLRR